MVCPDILPRVKRKKVKVCFYITTYHHPLADLFIPTSTRLLWEALSHAAINARRLFTYISTAVYSQVLI